jgi:peptidoglycan/xylan/chitin deacetylase (PgdA/CDA1 family)
MKFIAQHFTTITFSDLVASYRGEKELPDVPIIIAFDDGFRDVYVNAVPVLEDFGLNSTFFIIGDPLDSGNAPWLHAMYEILDREPLGRVASALAQALPGVPWGDFIDKAILLSRIRRVFHNDELDRTERRDLLRRVRRALGYPADWRTELFMDKESIRSLMGKGFEVGCHSMEHEYLSRLSDADLRQDIERSSEVISQASGKEAKAFCFPFGTAASWDDRVVRAVAAKGYESACSTEPGSNGRNADLFRLRRIDMSCDFSLSRFSFRVHGIDRLLQNSVRKAVYSSRRSR